MGFRLVELKLPTGYSDGDLEQRISRITRLRKFTWQIDSKSLDARNKSNIHWLMKVGVHSDEIGKGEDEPRHEPLVIPFRKRKARVIVTGSGPAGFFAAFVLQRAGFSTMILEKGAEVADREEGILQFEKTGVFNPVANYAFGEGGAGTFSDGKLTSRSKHISKERDFFLRSYVEAGAPPEIRYLNHPHVGSDNLRTVVLNLRRQFIGSGGTVRFGTRLENITFRNSRVEGVETSDGDFETELLILAPGHSAYETYRMLMARGVQFRTKNFAIGFRAEHPQNIINKAQWGVESLPGVKAAEYRLTSDLPGRQPVYSFCMCPGGMVVPAATSNDVNIVNGMSNYRRDGRFANAGFVAGVHPDQLAGRQVSAAGALDWLEELERSFYRYSKGFRAPFSTIADFLRGAVTDSCPSSSYPLGLIPAPLREMLPEVVAGALTEGMKDFCRRVKGYDQGILLGLESKTSSPVQVIREDDGRCTGFENLYMAGEGGGYAGGIVSSAADGIRVAMKIAESVN